MIGKKDKKNNDNFSSSQSLVNQNTTLSIWEPNDSLILINFQNFSKMIKTSNLKFKALKDKISIETERINY
jgi:hypothetical protein